MKIKFVAVISSIVILAVIYFKVINTNKNAAPKNPVMSQEVEVTVTKAKKEMISPIIELPARITANKISEVRPQVDGIIRKVLFEEGSFVKAGEALYQIDPTIYKADLESSVAKLKAAQLRKERYEQLLKIEAISKQEYDDAIASLKEAQAESTKSNAYLSYTKVYAPISGYITKSNVTEGALVIANQTQAIATIADLDPIFADIMMPSRNLLKISDQKNITVTIVVDEVEYDNKGILKFSEVIVDESTDSVRLRAKFSNSSKKLLPGMFVNVRLHLQEVEALTIPQRTTIRGNDGNLAVFVVNEENIAKMKIVKAEKMNGSDWIISEGLEEGETIIYEGFQKVTDGAKVKTVPLKMESETEEEEVKK
jgi:membrane fusion protein (multidrug efflux system)